MPACLQAKAAKWNQRWADRIAEKPGSEFKWATYEGKMVNEHLESVLLGMTKNHCAFCDGYELGADIEPTIEHFRPKSSFPLLAYEWSNLFPACRYCQRKNNEFDERLLKPDEPDYDFYRYFYFDDETGALLPNPAADEDTQKRAEITIHLYDLCGSNRRTINQLRLRHCKLFRAGLIKNEEIELYPYRYIYSA